jgi:hypothetical protein
MKPKEYIKKYKLDVQEQFNHNNFIVDLTADFMAVIEYLASTNNFNYNRFKIVIKEIRQKFDGISNKAKGKGLPESLWKYFYATVIIKVKNELFGDYLKKKETAYYKQREENQRFYEWQSFSSFSSFGTFDNMFNRFANFFIQASIPTPVKSFEKLGLTSEATENSIKTAFRKLSLIYHPDKGGNANDFIKIIEAKNSCLAYVANKS